jgi:hypothetical protein
MEKRVDKKNYSEIPENNGDECRFKHWRDSPPGGAGKASEIA